MGWLDETLRNKEKVREENDMVMVNNASHKSNKKTKKKLMYPPLNMKLNDHQVAICTL